MNPFSKLIIAFLSGLAFTVTVLAICWAAYLYLSDPWKYIVTVVLVLSTFTYLSYRGLFNDSE